MPHTTSMHILQPTANFAPKKREQVFIALLLCMGVLLPLSLAHATPSISLDKTSVYPGDSIRFTIQDTIGSGGSSTNHTYFTRCKAVVYTNDTGSGNNADGDIAASIDLGRSKYYKNSSYKVSATFTATEKMLRGSGSASLKVNGHFYCDGGTGGRSSYKYWDGAWKSASWTLTKKITCNPSEPTIRVRNASATTSSATFEVKITNNRCGDISPTTKMYIDNSLVRTELGSTIAPGSSKTSNQTTSQALNPGDHTIKACLDSTSGGACDSQTVNVAAPAGCTYNNPACGSDSDCVNNSCVLKSGCQYNNPACGSGLSCVNNQCIYPEPAAPVISGINASYKVGEKVSFSATGTIGGPHPNYSNCEAVVYSNFVGTDNADKAIPEHIAFGARERGASIQTSGTFTVNTAMLNAGASQEVEFRIRYSCSGGTGGTSSYTYWSGAWATQKWTANPLPACIDGTPTISLKDIIADTKGVNFTADITNKRCTDITPVATPSLDGTAFPPTLISSPIAPTSTYALKSGIQSTLTVATHELKVCLDYGSGGACAIKQFTVGTVTPIDQDTAPVISGISTSHTVGTKVNFSATGAIGGPHTNYTNCEAIVYSNFQNTDNVDKSIPERITLGAQPKGAKLTVSGAFTVTNAMANGAQVEFKIRYTCTGGTGGDTSYTTWVGPWGIKPWTARVQLPLCMAAISDPPTVAIKTLDADKNGVRLSADIISNTACNDISPVITPYLDGTALPLIILVNAIAPRATYTLSHTITQTLAEGNHELKVCAKTRIEGESCATQAFTVKPPEGCLYNNPACGSDSDCVENKCVLKQGCQYKNPECATGYSCQNNSCVLENKIIFLGAAKDMLQTQSTCPPKGTQTATKECLDRLAMEYDAQKAEEERVWEQVETIAEKVGEGITLAYAVTCATCLGSIPTTIALAAACPETAITCGPAYFIGNNVMPISCGICLGESVLFESGWVALTYRASKLTEFLKLSQTAETIKGATLVKNSEIFSPEAEMATFRYIKNGIERTKATILKPSQAKAVSYETNQFARIPKGKQFVRFFDKYSIMFKSEVTQSNIKAMEELIAKNFAKNIEEALQAVGIFRKLSDLKITITFVDSLAEGCAYGCVRPIFRDAAGLLNIEFQFPVISNLGSKHAMIVTESSVFHEATHAILNILRIEKEIPRLPPGHYVEELFADILPYQLSSTAQSTKISYRTATEEKFLTTIGNPSTWGKDASEESLIRLYITAKELKSEKLTTALEEAILAKSKENRTHAESFKAWLETVYTNNFASPLQTIAEQITKENPGPELFEALKKISLFSIITPAFIPPTPCSITSVAWDPADKATDGVTLTLRAKGTPECTGKTIQFAVYKTNSSASVATLTDTTFEAGEFTTQWPIKWALESDGLPSTYYFVATPSEGEKKQSANIVSQPVPAPPSTATLSSSCTPGGIYWISYANDPMKKTLQAQGSDGCKGKKLQFQVYRRMGNLNYPVAYVQSKLFQGGDFLGDWRAPGYGTYIFKVFSPTGENWPTTSSVPFPICRNKRTSC